MPYEDDEWYRRREERLARQEWLDAGYARRQAVVLFLWIVFILIAVSVFALTMWMIHEVIFVPGAPQELLPHDA